MLNSGYECFFLIMSLVLPLITLYVYMVFIWDEYAA